MNAIFSYWRERIQSLSAYALIGGILFGVYLIVNLFTHKPQTTSTTKTKVESGGVANITNINNAVEDFKQGIYGRISSTRAGIGVFKEVTKNIDISIGGNKRYDSDEVDVEVETRFKF